MNPPYSSGQSSANDNNQNQKYPALDKSIEGSYAKLSTATLKNSLYDSYIRGIRWASNRIKDDGVIAFVSNGSFIDGNTADGIRKTFAAEFSRIFVYNLRGNQRTSGEVSRKEGGKIFGSGSRTQVAICILIKNSARSGPAEIQYRDIGDYLTREQKLDILAAEGSLESTEWERITSNEHGDWVNQRDDGYDAFQAIGDKATKGTSGTVAMFENYSGGLKSNRDVWVYGFSAAAVEAQVQLLISTYETERLAGSGKPTMDPARISWSPGLLQRYRAGKELRFVPGSVVVGPYRPFCKQNLYFDASLIERPGQLSKLFPTPAHPNRAITLPGPGSAGEFYSLIHDQIPALGVATSLQCFSLYTYAPLPEGEFPILNDGETIVDGYRRRDNVTDATLDAYRKLYSDPAIGKEHIFDYVYGLLHSPSYKKTYRADLMKMLPRIPKVQDFWGFSSSGHALAELHLNYEKATPHPLVETSKRTVPNDRDSQFDYYGVNKMSFVGRKDRSGIVYNSHITVTGIPEEVFQYVLMGNKSAIEWILDRYQVTKHKDSQITNNPNDYSREADNPRYIIDLLARIVTVSLETVRIVAALPPLVILDENPS